MIRSQITKRWRAHLVQKLQDRYGLAQESAEKKADAWLQWIEKRPSQPHTASRSAKSKTASASRL